MAKSRPRRRGTAQSGRLARQLVVFKSLSRDQRVNWTEVRLASFCGVSTTMVHKWMIEHPLARARP